VRNEAQQNPDTSRALCAEGENIMKTWPGEPACQRREICKNNDFEATLLLYCVQILEIGPTGQSTDVLLQN